MWSSLWPSFIFIAVTCSVFFLSLAVYQVLVKAFERYKEHYVTKSMTDLSDMFLFIDAGQILVLTGASVVLLGVLGWIFINPAVAILLAAAGAFAPTFLVRFYRARRIKLFNAQLVDALQAMSSAMRAGLTLQQAVEQIAREAPVPLSQEFGLFVKEVKFGVSFEEALVNMAHNVGSDDLDLVVTSANIARQLGGNMAEMFETISATIRERFRLEGKIQSMTAQGKLSGWIVAALPLVLGVVINGMRPDLMEPMLEHWFGWVLIASIVIMEALGIFFIRKIVDIDV
jgi:tight adherence protein B